MHLRSPQGERSPGATAGVLLPNLITIASDVSDLNGLCRDSKASRQFERPIFLMSSHTLTPLLVANTMKAGNSEQSRSA